MRLAVSGETSPSSPRSALETVDWLTLAALAMSLMVTGFMWRLWQVVRILDGRRLPSWTGRRLCRAHWKVLELNGNRLPCRDRESGRGMKRRRSEHSVERHQVE